MDCAPVTKLADGSGWLYEIKFDGYRAVAVKSDRRVTLFSRRRKSFDHHYPYLVEALAELPEGTVVDGEIVALDESGRPNLIPTIIGEGGQDWPAVAAGTTIFLVPILVFTVLLRKQLLRGITFGAVRK